MENERLVNTFSGQVQTQLTWTTNWIAHANSLKKRAQHSH